MNRDRSSRCEKPERVYRRTFPSRLLKRWAELGRCAMLGRPVLWAASGCPVMPYNLKPNQEYKCASYQDRVEITPHINSQYVEFKTYAVPDGPFAPDLRAYGGNGPNGPPNGGGGGSYTGYERVVTVGTPIKKEASTMKLEPPDFIHTDTVGNMHYYCISNEARLRLAEKVDAFRLDSENGPADACVDEPASPFPFNYTDASIVTKRIIDEANKLGPAN